MSKRRVTTGAAPAVEPPLEPDEVTPAIRDVAYRLTHDLKDTREDLRDAVAFAPLAAIKLAQRGTDLLTRRPRQTLLSLAGLAAVTVSFVLTWRKRRA